MTSTAGFKNILKTVSVFILILGISGALYSKGDRSYRSHVREWTRHKQWYSPKTMQADMLWHATYFSPDFRRAQERETIKRKYLDPVEASQYIAEQERRQTALDEFFIGLYTIKPYREFSLGEESFWQARLYTENGQELEPIGVELVEIKPFEKILYPYLGRWDKAYRVTFPKVELGKTFTLVLRSVIGETDLKWDLDSEAKHSLESFEEPLPGEGQ